MKYLLLLAILLSFGCSQVNFSSQEVLNGEKWGKRHTEELRIIHQNVVNWELANRSRRVNVDFDVWVHNTFLIFPHEERMTSAENRRYERQNTRARRLRALVEERGTADWREFTR